MVALFVIVPALCGLTVMVAVAVPELASVPMSQVTTPDACVQLPWVAVAETKVTPAGNVSVIVTPVALDGPPFVPVTV
jgi:hypothetical protein